jgi:hypothetical protein
VIGQRAEWGLEEGAMERVIGGDSLVDRYSGTRLTSKDNAVHGAGPEAVRERGCLAGGVARNPG